MRWVEAYTQSAVLNRTPLDVGPIFAQQIAAGKRAWIFTSATLSVGGDFRHFQSELGLREAATGHWESPYDFTSQALLYVPEGMPEPNSAGYTEAVIDAAFPVIEASRGRAAATAEPELGRSRRRQPIRSRKHPRQQLRVGGGVKITRVRTAHVHAGRLARRVDEYGQLLGRQLQPYEQRPILHPDHLTGRRDQRKPGEDRRLPAMIYVSYAKTV